MDSDLYSHALERYSQGDKKGALVVLEEYLAGALPPAAGDEATVSQALYLKANLLHQIDADPIDIVRACKAFWNHDAGCAAPADAESRASLSLFHAMALEALGLDDEAIVYFGDVADLCMQHRTPLVERSAAPALLSLIRLHFAHDRHGDALNGLSMLLELLRDTGNAEVVGVLSAAMYMAVSKGCAEPEMKVTRGLALAMAETASLHAKDLAPLKSIRMALACAWGFYASGDRERGADWIGKLTAAMPEKFEPEMAKLFLAAKLLERKYSS